MARILIVGCNGQIGTELTLRLRSMHGEEEVVGSDIQPVRENLVKGPFELLDATDAEALEKIVSAYQIREVYLMAALLSAKSEQLPQQAWEVNMKSLLNTLELARVYRFRLFWPSSIAVFGPGSPGEWTPQETILDPTTVYGISKLAGERWCAYYRLKHGVDVRSLRYPGLISWKAAPGGGTTDYSIDMFVHASRGEDYDCYLKEDSRLPMMYMDDAIGGTIDLMTAQLDEQLPFLSYNLQGFSCTPAELAAEIQKEFPGFNTSYHPDFRQHIADSWPDSIDDQQAREHWGWSPSFDLQATSRAMIFGLRRPVRNS